MIYIHTYARRRIHMYVKTHTNKQTAWLRQMCYHKDAEYFCKKEGEFIFYILLFYPIYHRYILHYWHFNGILHNIMSLTELYPSW